MHTLKTEQGSALIYLLFLMAMIGIVGAFMLSTVTYGQRVLVNQKEVQDEFYRSEGALEIVLKEMQEYVISEEEPVLDEDGEQVLDENGQPIFVQVEKRGPYYYLLYEVAPTKMFSPYEIGGEYVQVKAERISGTGNEMMASLQARFVDENKHHSTREVTLKATAGDQYLPPPPKQGGRSSFSIGYKSLKADQRRSNIQIPEDKVRSPLPEYRDILRGVHEFRTYSTPPSSQPQHMYEKRNGSVVELGGQRRHENIHLTGNRAHLLVNEDAYVVANNTILIEGNNSMLTLKRNAYVRAKEIKLSKNNQHIEILPGAFVEVDELTIEGNHSTLIIHEGAVVVAKEMEIRDASVSIFGFLVVENLEIERQGSLIVQSGLVVQNDLEVGDHRGSIIGEFKGIDCKYLSYVQQNGCGSENNREDENHNPEYPGYIWRSSMSIEEYGTVR